MASQNGFDAIVNAANADLKPGGGVAGVIHRAAGKGLYEECKQLAPIKTGEAVITSGHNLPNRYVIHTLGPIYGVDENPAEKLADSYRNSIKKAEENQLKSIAFPAISTGFFGYPMKEAAHIAFSTILKLIPKLRFIKHIRFVLYSDRDLAIHEEILSALIGN
ncbi:MAG: macro domain-containing protein [Candidatus Thermoplasmatota archaeon]